MRCKLCGSSKINQIYNGLIRDGGLGRYTEKLIKIWKCDDCDVIWHDGLNNIQSYYESEAYRNALEGSSTVELFYKLHDKDTLDKFQYTGTDIFRQKTVADIGCGAGAFLDFLKGVAKDIVAVEPSAAYRRVMDEKGYHTYAYAEAAIREWGNRINVATSFDVIEHVENPQEFLMNIFDLLTVGGQAVIGTPTETPIMRKLLGKIYEKKLLFSTQHLWVFSDKNLEMMAKNVGFVKIDFKFYQRYGLENLFGWLRDKEPCSEIVEDFITPTLNAVWKSECAEHGMSDYIVMYLTK